MTEENWLECVAPQKMLEFMRGKVSDRKLRLFACACCRKIEQWLIDKRVRKVVEIAEMRADGLATGENIAAFIGAANTAIQSLHAYETVRRYTYHAAVSTGDVSAWNAAVSSVNSILTAANGGFWNHHASNDSKTRNAQCRLLRDFLPNPFRPISIHQIWLSPSVRNLATATYEQRALPSGELDNNSLSILADALEEAGCDNLEILGHFRSPEPHVRGCHVLDLILGKD